MYVGPVFGEDVAELDLVDPAQPDQLFVEADPSNRCRSRSVVDVLILAQIRDRKVELQFG